MKGLIVRIGIDQAFGGWNAPVDPETLEFVYVPIPEGTRTIFHPGLETTFEEFSDDIRSFSSSHGCDLILPPKLNNLKSHLDPDFSQLTYGDDAKARGSRLTKLHSGDLVVFYAGLKPIRPCSHKLIYAIIGYYFVDEIVYVDKIPESRWYENAHTRKATRGHDLIVRARSEKSGRLKRCIPIGEYRNRAYRVRADLLSAWGGLDVKDGYLQRSAVPPFLVDAQGFANWLKEQGPEWMQKNN